MSLNLQATVSVNGQERTVFYQEYAPKMAVYVPGEKPKWLPPAPTISSTSYRNGSLVFRAACELAWRIWGTQTDSVTYPFGELTPEEEEKLEWNPSTK